MNRKKLIKGLSIIATLLAIGMLAILVLVFVALPSPEKIREAMFSSARKIAEKPAATSAHTPSPETSLPDAKSAAPSAPATAAKQDDEFEKHRREDEETFDRFLSETAPLSSACASLGTIQYPQNKKLDSREFATRLKTSLEGAHVDPEFDSARPFLKYVLTQPKIREMTEQIRNENPKTVVESIKSKTKFYSLAYDAYVELKAREDDMRQIINQNYLTMMLGRAVEAKPLLAHDRATEDYCAEIEKHINDGTPPDFTQEKRSFEEFLAKNEINPKAIGYDPNYETQLKVEFGSNQITANGGWIYDFLMQAKPPEKQH